MKYKLFNIFAEAIFPHLYSGLTNEDASHIIHWGVNELYPKRIEGFEPPEAEKIFRNKKKFLNKDFEFQFEYTLENYNPFMQFSGYCQTAAMIHMHENKLYQDLDYIGFCQYDMKIPTSFFSDFLEKTEGKEDVIFYNLELGHPKETFFCCAPKGMIRDFNQVFDTSYDEKSFEKFAGYCHTFFIPMKMFNEMMEWICVLAYKMENEDEYKKKRDREWAGRAGILERAHALYLSHKIREGANRAQMKFEHTWPSVKRKTRYGKGIIPTLDKKAKEWFLSDVELNEPHAKGRCSSGAINPFPREGQQAKRILSKQARLSKEPEKAFPLDQSSSLPLQCGITGAKMNEEGEIISKTPTGGWSPR